MNESIEDSSVDVNFSGKTTISLADIPVNSYEEYDEDVESKTLIIDTGNPTAIKITGGKVLNLVSETNSILKKPTTKVDFSSLNIDPVKLTEDLLLTAKEHKALGLAANQCGIPYSAIAVGDGETHFVMINPEILSVSEETVHLQEGCLSFPFLLLAITRPKDVEVKFQDFNGVEYTKNFSGLSARIIQHEIDHLNGITFDTVAKPFALKKSLLSREKNIKKYARDLIKSGMVKNGRIVNRDSENA